jgi:hypothetical protein
MEYLGGDDFKEKEPTGPGALIMMDPRGIPYLQPA